MTLSEKLTIASLGLGGLGSLLFVVYKAKSGKKNSLIANSSKILIAISLILLTIAVLVLSKSKEPFTSTHLENNECAKKPPLLKQPTNKMSTGKCKVYQPKRGLDQLNVTKKVTNDTIQFHAPLYKSGSSSQSEYTKHDADTYLVSKHIKYAGHMSTTNAHSAFITGTCKKIHRDKAVQKCESLGPYTLDCKKSFDNDNVFMCKGGASVNENQEMNTSKYRRLVTICPDDGLHAALGYIESSNGSNTIVHESFCDNINGKSDDLGV